MASKRHDAVRSIELYTDVLARLTALSDVEAAATIVHMMRAIENYPPTVRMPIVEESNNPEWAAWIARIHSLIQVRDWVVVEQPKEAQRIIE